MKPIHLVLAALANLAFAGVIVFAAMAVSQGDGRPRNPDTPENQIDAKSAALLDLLADERLRNQQQREQLNQQIIKVLNEHSKSIAQIQSSLAAIDAKKQGDKKDSEKVLTPQSDSD